MNGWSPLLPFLGLVNAFYTAQVVNNKECSILAKQNSLSCKVTKVENQQIESRVSGCGTVGRAVASDFRVPWFESQHR